ADGGEIQHYRRSDSDYAYAEDLRRFQLSLTVDADLRHDQMPRVTLHFIVAQGRKGAVPLFGRRLGDRASRKGVRPLFSPACDRRDDADRVARCNRRLLFLQVADVFVVDVDVDEAAQLPLIVVEMRLQSRVLARE